MIAHMPDRDRLNAVDPAVIDALSFLDSPADAILNARQLEDLAAATADIAGRDRAPAYPATLYVILKATRLCNLRCSYCSAWREGADQVMSFAMMARVVSQAMTLPGIRTLHFVWHGGETTLLSRSYFERALWLQEHFRIDRRRVEHAIQTNATRIDDDWARFFKAAGFSVGVSLDIDHRNHDRQRQFKGGGGSFAATRSGIDTLRRHGLAHGFLAVVDQQCLSIGARGMLERLVEQDVGTVGLLNALPANDERATPTPYLPWDRYVGFLREVFDEWARDFRDRIVIRELESLFRIVGGASSRLCIYQGGCMGQYLTIEPDGAVSACDKYVGDMDYRFGSLAESGLYDILTGSAALERSRMDAKSLLDRFTTCANYAHCRGGCPHDARLNARHGRTGACCGLSDLIDDMKARIEEDGDG
jgi:uncharacterized protein